MPSPLTDACGHPCVYANRSSIAHVRPKPPPSNIRVTVLASRTQLPSRMFLTQASVTRSADFSPKRSLDERPQHLRCFLRIRSHSILLNRAQIIMPPTELTPAGLRTLATHLGLSLASAVSHHGLAGGGYESAIGTRRTFLAHLDHTVGADAVFGVL